MYDNLNVSFLLWDELHLYFVTFLLLASIDYTYMLLRLWIQMFLLICPTIQPNRREYRSLARASLLSLASRWLFHDWIFSPKTSPNVQYILFDRIFYIFVWILWMFIGTWTSLWLILIGMGKVFTFDMADIGYESFREFYLVFDTQEFRNGMQGVFVRHGHAVGRLYGHEDNVCQV